MLKLVNKMKMLFQKIWTGYKKVARAIGRFNTLVILSLLYFLVIPFFSIISRLMKGKKEKNSTWITKEPALPNSHEHQF